MCIQSLRVTLGAIGIAFMGVHAVAAPAVPQSQTEKEQNKSVTSTDGTDSNDEQIPVPVIDLALRREFLLKTVTVADRIPDEKARTAAQWRLVTPLVNLGLKDQAFEQAMKLRTVNPQTCIYSLRTIAKDALKEGDQTTVQEAWDAAQKANRGAEKGWYNHYVIQMGFKLNRPLPEMVAIASAAKRNVQQRAFQDIRNELAWRGRVDEAYAITAAHLPQLSSNFNDREIAYYCSNAKHFDYYAKHDHFGQAVRIIEQMPKSKDRNAAISQLINGLLYVANKDLVPEERFTLAENWVGQIEDRILQAKSRAQILRKRLPTTSIDELEQNLTEVTSREEKRQYLQRIFTRLVEEKRFEEADRILPREVELIKAQPRPEVRSKFGNVDDADAIRIITWTRHAALVRALHKEGRTKEACARLEAMKDLPDSEPFFLVGNLAGIRRQLFMELEDFDSVVEITTEKSEPIAVLGMAVWMMEKNQFERGWKHVAPLMELPSESIFPPGKVGKNLYFAAQPFADLARQLFKVNRPDDALTIVNKLPESPDTAHAFETFGELLVQTGRFAEFDKWLAQLPHKTARTHARMGALRQMSKPLE